MINFLVGSGGKSLEATAELADDLRPRDVRDEEATAGSGDSHIDEVSHLPLRPAVRHLRLTRPRPSRISICHGRSRSYPAFDVGQVPGGQLVVGLGDRFQETVEPPLALGLELLDAPGIIVAMAAPYIARDAQIQPFMLCALHGSVLQECQFVRASRIPHSFTSTLNPRLE